LPGILSRNGPALNQDWFDTQAAQQAKGFANSVFMDGTLKRQQAKGLMEHFTRRRLPQRSIANTPPTETGAAGFVEERRDLI
jgi:hypothetical protein